jgi:L-ascorbate metabolism protein UlaG (beta-lactamase superfamily)
LLAVVPAWGEINPELHRDLEKGEAVVWYLHHSGWAVRTASHLLIFDYVRHHLDVALASIAHGVIEPTEIAHLNVVVFVSHSHSDHFDPSIFAWRDRIPSLTFVFGWPATQAATADIVLGEKRLQKKTGACQIFNIHHEFDGILESAFLVEVDGLTLVHAGDHGHSKGMKNSEFESNIRYLAKKANTVDLFFTPTFGGEIDAIRALKPRLVLPMHDGGRENQYQRFKEKAARSGLESEIWAATRAGDSFVFKVGQGVLIRNSTAIDSVQ